MKRWVLVVFGILVIGSAFFWAYRIKGSGGAGDAAQPKKPKPLVAVQSVQKGEISHTLELTGSVEPTRVARLASPAEGPIMNCRVREGDAVTQGSRVLSIGRRKATEALLTSAEQDLKTEKEELARIEKLVESGAIPKDQLETAKAKRSRMAANLERVKENTADYEVEVPWDGIVSKVLVADGNYVAARSPLVEVFDPASLVVRMAVPEAQSLEIRTDMEVSVGLDAHSGKKFKGKVVRVYPELDRRMRTRIAEVQVTDKVDLVPGMFARLNLALRSERDAVVVPSDAVIVTPKGLRVAYVIQDDKAIQRKVTTGIESGGKTQILSGVKPGERIVVAGNEKLKDGTEVRMPPDKKPSEEGGAKGASDRGGAGK
ncbi:MAG: efflux RND transporter periplasmic adaptor subunit [Pseudomonadota bacterium]